MTRAAVLLGILMLILTACSGDAVAEVYTAAGDATDPGELTATTRFAADDDLNVVVRLNPHTRSVALRAVFLGPDGTQIATDTLEAEPTVGEVLLGLDWEVLGSGDWPAGDWQVEVYADDARFSTLDFAVQARPE